MQVNGEVMDCIDVYKPVFKGLVTGCELYDTPTVRYWHRSKQQLESDTSNDNILDDERDDESNVLLRCQSCFRQLNKKANLGNHRCIVKQTSNTVVQYCMEYTLNCISVEDLE